MTTANQDRALQAGIDFSMQHIRAMEGKTIHVTLDSKDQPVINTHRPRGNPDPYYTVESYWPWLAVAWNQNRHDDEIVKALQRSDRYGRKVRS